RGHLDFSQIAHAFGEYLIHKPRKNGRDEALEADALGIDARLIFVHHRHDRVHLRPEKLAFEGGRVAFAWIFSCPLLKESYRVGKDLLSREALVAYGGIVDHILVARNDRPRGAQQ